MTFAKALKTAGWMALLSLCCSFAGHPQSLAPKPTPPAYVPFKLGETFTYNISWKVFDAGIAIMTLGDKFNYQGEEVYKISATVRSQGIVGRVFPVLDAFESYLQTQELCSRKIVKFAREGWRQRDTVVTFDPKKHQASMEDKAPNKPQLPVKRTETPIPPCVQDVISALYVVRTMNLKVGDRFRFPINDGGNTYDVIVEVQAEETVKTPAGTFQALRLEPQVFGGLFQKKGRMFIWLAKDAAKTPVQIKARIAIGTITATLAKIEAGTTLRATPTQH